MNVDKILRTSAAKTPAGAQKVLLDFADLLCVFAHLVPETLEISKRVETLQIVPHVFVETLPLQPPRCLSFVKRLCSINMLQNRFADVFARCDTIDKFRMQNLADCMRLREMFVMLLHFSDLMEKENGK